MTGEPTRTRGRDATSMPPAAASSPSEPPPRRSAATALAPLPWLTLVLLFLIAFASARAIARDAAMRGSDRDGAPSPSRPDGPRFIAWDLILVPAGSLAAWQVELVVSDGQPGIDAPRLVGLESGDHPFDVPPVYDPQALALDRAVIAAYTLAPIDDLPRRHFRAATIHVEDVGDTASRPSVLPPGRAPAASVPPRVIVMAAAGPDGAPIAVEALLVRRATRSDAP